MQHTDLGVSIRRAPSNALVAVTSIGSATPVAGAKVEVRVAGRERDAVLWTGTTDAAGLAIVDADSFTDCRQCDLLAIVSKDKELAYAQSRWREWGTDWPSESFETGTEESSTTVPRTCRPQLPAGQRYVATMFSDRGGVYRLGDEVKLKGIVRVDNGRGLELPGRARGCASRSPTTPTPSCRSRLSRSPSSARSTSPRSSLATGDRAATPHGSSGSTAAPAGS